MHLDREAERRRQTLGDVVPRLAPVLRAPDTVMVLLVEHIPVPWRPHEVVHAVPNLSLVGEVVATLPGDAPIFGSEHTGRRDPEPHLLGISRVSDDRMQHQPGSTRAPLRGGRVVGERVDNLPGDSVIIAGEQRRGLGSRIQPVPTLASDQTWANRSPNGGTSGVQPIISAKSASAAAHSSTSPVESFANDHVCPASSERHTPAPDQPPPPPAQSLPVIGSPMTWLIGQPSQYGPRTVHVRRSEVPSRTKAPFVVPTSRRGAGLGIGASPSRRVSSSG